MNSNQTLGIGLISGATGGIGDAITHALVDRFERVLLVGRDLEKLKHLQTQLARSNVDILATDLNTCTTDSELLQWVEKMGQLDTWIHTAAISHIGEFEAQDAEHIKLMLQSNLVSPMLWTQKLHPWLQRSNHAQIIFLGSVLGWIGHPGYASYCSSKAGLHAFAQSLAREWSDQSIRVRLFAPRATATSFNNQRAQAMQKATSAHVDSAASVAAEFAQFVESRSPLHVVGLPERFFALINHIKPSWVSISMRKAVHTLRSTQLL